MSRRLGEFERIERFLRPLTRDFPDAFALTDDAGRVPVSPGRELLVTTDAMVEGVHYLPEEPPDRLARKLLRVNLSDLAAMGAVPLAYTLTTALPGSVEDSWLERFAAGLGADQERYGIELLGGDSVSTPGPPLVSVTAFGTCAPDRFLRRSGARPGDSLWVSGTVGDGALGLEAARGNLADLDPRHVEALAGRYHLPEPRLGLGQALVGLATAAIDLSDGLAGDIRHVCRASGVGAQIDTAALPFSDAARAALAADPRRRARAVAGGDDYELLFTAPAGRDPALSTLSSRLGLTLSRIGTMTGDGDIVLLDADGQVMTGLSGWTHF